MVARDIDIISLGVIIGAIGTPESMARAVGRLCSRQVHIVRLVILQESVVSGAVTTHAMAVGGPSSCRRGWRLPERVRVCRRGAGSDAVLQATGWWRRLAGDRLDPKVVVKEVVCMDGTRWMASVVVCKGGMGGKDNNKPKSAVLLKSGHHMGRNEEDKGEGEFSICGGKECWVCHATHLVVPVAPKLAANALCCYRREQVRISTGSATTTTPCQSLVVLSHPMRGLG